MDVLALMMEGKSNKAISRALDLAEPTVKYHVAAILKALKATNRTEAALSAAKLRWIPPQRGRPGARTERANPVVAAAFAQRAHESDAEVAAMPTSRSPAPSLPDRPSIVVMPFNNLSDDTSQSYFADGMTEDITIALGRLPWLFVIGSASAFTYKLRPVDLRHVGRELGVRYALSGSVRKERDRIRITVQLADTSNGNHLWADRFEDELGGIFAMQDRVAIHVSSTIAPALRREEIERARRKPTENLTAYDLFLRALPLYRSSATGSEEALNLLHRATELDPSYSSAYGLAAISFFWKRLHGWMSPSDPRLAQGIQFAHSAAQAGVNDPEALWMAAHALSMLAGDFETASDLATKSLTLNPNSSEAWAVLAMICGSLCDTKTSLEHFERARRLSPLEFPFVSHWAALSHTHFVAKDFVEVVRCADRALAEKADLAAMRMKIAACGTLGRLDEARACAARLVALVPTTTISGLKAHYALLMRHQPGLIDDFVSGLRRSGLPE
jgi:TolB-like protein/DNA-binding CsgD family transcriptional regulator